MAVVLDEYGGVSGMVTHGGRAGGDRRRDRRRVRQATRSRPIRELGDGVCEALGRVHIDDLNERLGLGLPEDADFDTIGGFVFSELGHIPVVGEELEWQNVRITVLDATRRRIERVRIEPLETAPR